MPSIRQPGLLAVALLVAAEQQRSCSIGHGKGDDDPRRAPNRKGGGPCSSFSGCHGGGLCDAGRCVCDQTWTGPNCEALDLLPIEAAAAGWPFSEAAWAAPKLPADVGFPWGGAMAEVMMTRRASWR